MTDDEAIAARLVDELQTLMLHRDVPSALTFAAPPFEAYTLVAALQATSRHPGLSDVQRAIVVDIATQIADELIRLARGVVGPDSAIETTILMGFDPAHDRNLDGSPVAPPAVDPYAELDDDDDLDEDDDDTPDSYILGERRCRYVVPSFLRANPAEDEMELSKCARCGRFFVMDMPIRLFAGEGDDVLGMEVCESCAPLVMGLKEGR